MKSSWIEKNQTLHVRADVQRNDRNVDDANVVRLVNLHNMISCSGKKEVSSVQANLEIPVHYAAVLEREHRAGPDGMPCSAEGAADVVCGN